MDYPADWLPFDPAMYDHVTRLAGYVGRVATMVARVVYTLATDRPADVDLVTASNLTVGPCLTRSQPITFDLTFHYK